MSALAHPPEINEATENHSALNTCHGCGSLFRRAAQLWSCLKCGRVRVWGYDRPEDRSFLPLLNCEACTRTERHGFIGVAGR